MLSLKTLSLSLLLALLLNNAKAETLAENYVDVGKGALSDDDFFRALTCGAPARGVCKNSMMSFAKNKSAKLQLMVFAEQVDAATTKRFNQKIDDAIKQLNAITPALKINRVTAFGDFNEIDIAIYLTDFQAGDVIADTNTDLDGITIEGAAVNVIANVKLEIIRSTIVFAGDLSGSEETSIVLEEITQSLGPINDIQGPYYKERSIFANDSNALTTLGEQDKTVLLKLYDRQ